MLEKCLTFTRLTCLKEYQRIGVHLPTSLVKFTTLLTPPKQPPKKTENKANPYLLKSYQIQPEHKRTTGSKRVHILQWLLHLSIAPKTHKISPSPTQILEQNCGSSTYNLIMAQCPWQAHCALNRRLVTKNAYLNI